MPRVFANRPATEDRVLTLQKRSPAFIVAGMSTPEPTNWVYLAPKPGSYYRQLYIKGKKIAAFTLYCQHLGTDDEPGMTVEEVADDWDLPIEAVREAIAYCSSDPQEIREDWELDEAIAEATGMNDPNYKYHPTPKILPPEEMARIRRRFGRA
jgi:hypothetical protein